MWWKIKSLYVGDGCHDSFKNSVTLIWPQSRPE
jgi:hypothetical protein